MLSELAPRPYRIGARDEIEHFRTLAMAEGRVYQTVSGFNIQEFCYQQYSGDYNAWVILGRGERYLENTSLVPLYIRTQLAEPILSRVIPADRRDNLSNSIVNMPPNFEKSRQILEFGLILDHQGNLIGVDGNRFTHTKYVAEGYIDAKYGVYRKNRSNFDRGIMWDLVKGGNGKVLRPLDVKQEELPIPLTVRWVDTAMSYLNPDGPTLTASRIIEQPLIAA